MLNHAPLLMRVGIGSAKDGERQAGKVDRRRRDRRAGDCGCFSFGHLLRPSFHDFGNFESYCQPSDDGNDLTPLARYDFKSGEHRNNFVHSADRDSGDWNEQRNHIAFSDY
jgi:hypothetical protein